MENNLENRIEKERKGLPEELRRSAREASDSEFKKDVVPMKSTIELAKEKVDGLSKMSKKCFNTTRISSDTAKRLTAIVRGYGKDLSSSSCPRIASIGKSMFDCPSLETDSSVAGSRLASFARKLIVASEKESNNERVLLANKLVDISKSILSKKEPLTASQKEKIKKFLLASAECLEENDD